MRLFIMLLILAYSVNPLNALPPVPQFPDVFQPRVRINAGLDGKSLFIEECSACHVAYKPRYLPTESWAEILSNLSDHFGEDASLDQRTVSAIEDYMANNSRPSKRESNPLRITESRWWKRQHSEGEVSYMKRSRGVKTMSNCLACHGSI